MELTFKDEGLHPHGPENNWQESWAFAWRDAQSGVGGNHRASNWQNRGTSNLWCAVFHNRDKIYRLNLEDQPITQLPAGQLGIGCGPQHLFHDGERLRMTLDTPECQADLVIEDFKDSVEKFEDGGGMSVPVYRNHFNMHCAVRGTVVLNGVRHNITDGLGWRDHSWGPRTYDAKPAHRSFHGNFGPDLNFHLLVMLTPDGRIERRGHLVRDGVTYSFDTFTTRVEILEDGVTPVRATCHIFLNHGEKLTFHCEVQKGVFSQVQMFQAFFGAGVCRVSGRPDGFCNFEMTNNPRLGTQPIQLALGNTVRNGYYEIDIPTWQYEPL